MYGINKGSSKSLQNCAGIFGTPYPAVMKRLIVIVLLLNCCCASAQNFGIDVLKQVNVHRNSAFDGTFEVISNSVAPIAIGIPLVFAGASLRDKKYRQQAFVTGSSLLLSAGLTVVLKQVVDRERPYVTYPFIQRVGPPESSSSFPSNHTSVAFSTATSLSLLYPKWYVIVPSYSWAAAVGYSRMHLGVHYPGDVLAGAAIGAGSAWLCYKANRLFLARRQSKGKM